MKKKRNGFTLVEIMVATTVFTMVGAAAMSVFLSINRSMYGMSDTIALNARTRLVQERILFDVRAITKLTQSDGQSFAGEFVEYATGRTGKLSYSFQGGKLLRQVEFPGEAAKVSVVMDQLQTNLAKPTTSHFAYANRSGTSTTSFAEVRSIQFAMAPLPSGRQAAGLVTGTNDAFCSALVLLRNISG